MPPPVGSVSVMGLPDAVRVKWTGGFQGSPCSLDKGSNSLHALPVLEYKVERDGGTVFEDREERLKVENIAIKITAADIDTWRGIEDDSWPQNHHSGGLQEGVQYCFRVSARNAIGWGPPSRWSAPVGLIQPNSLDVEKHWVEGVYNFTEAKKNESDK